MTSRTITVSAMVGQATVLATLGLTMETTTGTVVLGPQALLAVLVQLGPLEPLAPFLLLLILLEALAM